MRVLFFVLSIVSVVGLAQNWMVDTDTVLANAQTPGVKSYGQQKRCVAANPGKTCVDFSGHNLRYERYVAGSWVVNAPSKTAFDAGVTADTSKKAAKVARRNSLKAAKAAINAATTVNDLKPVLKDILKELNELNGTE